MHESDLAIPLSATFHTGELIAQQRAGALEKMAAIGPRVIREFMPEQHRQFFEQIPFVVVGSQDDEGQPWASILVGRPGFITAPTEQQLNFQAAPHPSDPLHANLRNGAALGLLGIEPPTRRRNRANGVARDVRDKDFVIDITQSFGNCPKYIQAREPRLIDIDPDAPTATQTSARLTPAMRNLIAAADTFFIATTVNDHANLVTGRHGTDVSHRGGKPGFVRVDSRADGDTLTVPDFVGNSFFNTIGNLLTHPRAGLLFVDFSNGDLLYVRVTAEIIWGGPEVESFAGAQRLLRLQVVGAKLVGSVLPLRWGDAEQSPFLESMGAWN